MIARKLKNSVASLWETTYQHPFVQELGQGRLPQEKFKFYQLRATQLTREYKTFCHENNRVEYRSRLTI